MEALGINVFSLIVYSLLFLVLFIVLERSFLPALRKSIAERKALIDTNVKVKKQLELDREEVLSNAQIDAKKIVEEANKKAKEIVELADTDAKVIMNSAKEKSKAMLQETKELIDKKTRDSK